MAKVILNKSTKIKGKGLILAGVEVDVTAAEEKELIKNGFIGEAKKSNTPSNQKEIDALVKKVSELESTIADSKESKALESFKTENAQLLLDKNTLVSELETLKVKVSELESTPPVVADLTTPKAKV